MAIRSLLITVAVMVCMAVSPVMGFAQADRDKREMEANIQAIENDYREQCRKNEEKLQRLQEEYNNFLNTNTRPEKNNFFTNSQHNYDMQVEWYKSAIQSCKDNFEALRRERDTKIGIEKDAYRVAQKLQQQAEAQKRQAEAQKNKQIQARKAEIARQKQAEQERIEAEKRAAAKRRAEEAARRREEERKLEEQRYNEDKARYYQESAERYASRYQSAQYRASNEAMNDMYNNVSGYLLTPTLPQTGQTPDVGEMRPGFSAALESFLQMAEKEDSVAVKPNRSGQECYLAFLDGEDLNEQETELADQYQKQLVASKGVGGGVAQKGSDVSGMSGSPSGLEINQMSHAAVGRSGVGTGEIPLFGADDSVIDGLDPALPVAPTPSSYTMIGEVVYKLEEGQLSPINQEDAPSYFLGYDISHISSEADLIVIASDSEVFDFSSFYPSYMGARSSGYPGSVFVGLDGSVYQTIIRDATTMIEKWDESTRSFVPVAKYPGIADKVYAMPSHLLLVLSGDTILTQREGYWKTAYRSDRKINDFVVNESDIIALDDDGVYGIHGGSTWYISQTGGQRLLSAGQDYYVINNDSVTHINNQ